MDGKIDVPDSDALAYSKQVWASGLQYHKPPFTFRTENWEERARKILSVQSWGYVNGNAGQNSTYKKNLAAFDRYGIVPLRNVPSFKDENGKEQWANTSTTVFGEKLPFPVALAPIGVQRIFHREGELAACRAAASVGMPYILSTASSTSMEDVSAAHAETAAKAGHPADIVPHKWFQLYWPSREHDDITLSLLNRAKANGYSVLFVTLDAFALGWRPKDMDNGYNPFLHADRIGVEIGFTDPVFRKYFKDKYGYELDDHSHNQTINIEGGSMGVAAKLWSSIAFPGHAHSWEDLAFIRENWEGPICVKGIQTVADAEAAVKAKMDGIVVSNHGGRQQDGGHSSLGVLPRIVDAVGDKIDVLFDSGIRCGADVVKAIALGAKCVLIGRPFAYGLTGGEDGVKHVLRATAGDMTMTMHLAGLRNLSEVNRSIIVKEDDLF